MYSRLVQPPKKTSFFLFGPRGTGKSSWVKFFYPNATYVDLLDAETFTELLANPSRLRRHIEPTLDKKKGLTEIASDRVSTVIIDEVQKIPALLDEVHRQIEAKGRARDIQFVLTGSSARKLKHAGVNLLAGRAFQLSMFPLTARELGADFDLRFSLKYGLLPAVRTSEEPKKYLKSYVQTYLREEVMQEGLTRNLPAFSRFMEASSFSQGSLLNLSSVAEDCAVPRKTVESYFELLEDLLLAKRLSVFSKRAKRKLVGHPKFYYFDVGVFRALRPQGPLDSPDELDGIGLETLVYQELSALNSYLDLNYSLHFWRTDSKVEVDFVLYGERGLKAFEVKKSSKIKTEDLKGLKLFLSDYPKAQAYFLYGGERRFREDGIEILPIKAFFEEASQILSSD